jgi:hypothetical protein
MVYALTSVNRVSPIVSFNARMRALQPKKRKPALCVQSLRCCEQSTLPCNCRHGARMTGETRRCKCSTSLRQKSRCNMISLSLSAFIHASLQMKNCVKTHSEPIVFSPFHIREAEARCWRQVCRAPAPRTGGIARAAECRRVRRLFGSELDRKRHGYACCCDFLAEEGCVSFAVVAALCHRGGCFSLS